VSTNTGIGMAVTGSSIMSLLYAGAVFLVIGLFLVRRNRKFAATTEVLGS
jgi:LPXTG-motif cell wall-anchored protein